jgi:hypothetical protein
MLQNAKLYGFDQGHDTTFQGLGPGKVALSSSQWQTVIMIFYVGLVLFQVPGCIGYRILPPSKVRRTAALRSLLYVITTQDADLRTFALSG